MEPRILDYILNFKQQSYVINSDEETDPGPEWINCSLGVNPYGASNSVYDGLKKMDFSGISNYPNYPFKYIKEKIVRYWSDIIDIEMDQLGVGNGSMGILNGINKILVHQGTKVLGYSPQFIDYISNVQSYGGVYDYIKLKKENNYKFSASEFMDKISNDYTIIYIDNPNNPTGQVIPLMDLKTIIEKAEMMDIYVIIDEAYGDFMDKHNSAISLVGLYKNLFVVRSLSKGFGLAGLRVGYFLCQKVLMEIYKKIDLPFSIGSLSEEIAGFALDDQQFVDTSIQNIKIYKQKLINSFSAIKVLESCMQIPIMTLFLPDVNIDLFELFKKYKILTESGSYFLNLGKNYVRIRVPRRIDKLIQIINKLEQEL